MNQHKLNILVIGTYPFAGLMNLEYRLLFDVKVG
jgi:hypothetical protein